VSGVEGGGDVCGEGGEEMGERWTLFIFTERSDKRVIEGRDDTSQG